MKYDSKTLDKYRDVCVYDQWWDGVYDMWRDKMRAVGFDAGELCFSGFWSQGDGASFTGRVSDWPTFLDAHWPDQFPLVRSLAASKQIGGNVDRRCRHYCHENTVSFNIEYDDYDEDTGDGLTDALHHVWNTFLPDEIAAFEADAQDVLREYMREFYRDLEAEYEHLTSDETVADWLDANAEYLDAAA